MSKTSKPKTIRPFDGFNSVTDAVVVARGAAVQTGMGNANFPNPPADLKELKAAIDTFSALLAKALDGSKKVVAQKNKQRRVGRKVSTGGRRYVVSGRRRSGGRKKRDILAAVKSWRPGSLWSARVAHSFADANTLNFRSTSAIARRRGLKPRGLRFPANFGIAFVVRGPQPAGFLDLRECAKPIAMQRLLFTDAR